MSGDGSQEAEGCSDRADWLDSEEFTKIPEM